MAGPKTVSGKRNSSRNALKHGLFSSQLDISEGDRGEYERWKRDLQADLKPSGTLQESVFDDVVCSGWRYRIALRWEQQLIQKRLKEPETDADNEIKVQIAPGMVGGRQGLQRILKTLADVVNHVKHGGRLDDQVRQTLEATLGPEKVREILEWTEASNLELLMAQSIIHKAKAFEFELPAGEKPLSEREKRLLGVQHVQLGREYAQKLLELEYDHFRQQLAGLMEQSAHVSMQRTDPLELSMRYLTMLKRDFYRAIDRFFNLKTLTGTHDE